MRLCVEGRGGGGSDAKGAEPPEERVDVYGIEDCEGALGCVVADGGAEELVGDWVGLNVIEGRQGRDKEI